MKILPKIMLRHRNVPREKERKNKDKKQKTIFLSNKKEQKLHNVCKCFYCRNDRA